MVRDVPLTWLLEVDGLPVDARDLPAHLQLRAFELGLIPYLPAGRARVP